MQRRRYDGIGYEFAIKPLAWEYLLEGLDVKSKQTIEMIANGQMKSQYWEVSETLYLEILLDVQEFLTLYVNEVLASLCIKIFA